eukprot:TRINITY_DN5549_c0_g1_i13.p1 TRINITY_DN5549_c0_g1~~TRINITY_DN5549_c0_g1_i13.p1  ORF type:complete len:346 (+),score=39.69 TRINITY_DN5549_c0_g1_i13:57-1094(+)
MVLSFSQLQDLLPQIVDSEAWECISQDDSVSLWQSIAPIQTELIKAITVIPVTEPPQVCLPEANGFVRDLEVLQIISPGDSIIRVHLEWLPLMMARMVRSAMPPSSLSGPQARSSSRCSVIRRTLQRGYPKATDITVSHVPMDIDSPNSNMPSCVILRFDEQAGVLICIGCVEVISHQYQGLLSNSLSLFRHGARQFFRSRLESAGVWTNGPEHNRRFYVALRIKRLVKGPPLLPVWDADTGQAIRWEDQVGNDEGITLAGYLDQFLVRIGLINLQIFSSYAGLKLPRYMAVMETSSWERSRELFFRIFYEHASAYKIRYACNIFPSIDLVDVERVARGMKTKRA